MLQKVIDGKLTSEMPYRQKRKIKIDEIKDYIVKHGLDDFTEANIHSFSSSIDIAKYYANKAGLVLKVDPRRVQIITSEAHDFERLSGKDCVNGKNEKEYIVRIPSDYKWVFDDIVISDEDYLVAESNPISVQCFSHNDKIATYVMGGKNITAKFIWNGAGTKGSVYFMIGDGYYENRTVTKKALGFDPMPTEKNLSQISNFRVKLIKSW